jgi:hypothetical protein
MVITDASMQRIIRTFFRREYYHQNLWKCTCCKVPFIRNGFARTKKEQVDYYDPHYQVIITVKAIK